MEYDVGIIGSGPAGIQAGIHASRKKVSVAIFGKIKDSAVTDTHIENYFGIDSIEGNNLIKNGIDQATQFGCKIFGVNVISARSKNGAFILVTENEEEIKVKSVIIATGISRKKLGVPGEKELFGKGVSYCASCDCNFYKGKIVAIYGNDSEAAISAELMTKYASKTYWIYDTYNSSDLLFKKAKDSGVEIIQSKIKEIEGTDKVNSIILSNDLKIEIDGIFIELGAKSAADLAMDLELMPEIDDSIKVNEKCESVVKGIFACGDITGKPWQIAKAVGQGCVAGTYSAEYCKER